MLADSRGTWGGNSTRKNEEGLDTIISRIYLMISYTRDLVYYMSLGSHPDSETTNERKERLREIYDKYLFMAKKLEYLQCFVFPDLYRPYDLTATCVGPDVFKKLILLGDGFLMGDVGLLQALEQYHQYIRGMPVFKCNEGNGVKDIRAFWAKTWILREFQAGETSRANRAMVSFVYLSVLLHA